MAITRKLVNLIFVVVLVVTLFVGVTPPVLADQDSNEGSFSAYVFKDGEWQLQGVLHFSDYETLQMQLSNYTGQLKLRLVQEGHDGAYIDQVIVQKYGIPYLPTSAINIDNNTGVLTKILYPEYDVCNGWDSTLEIVWNNAPENATLVMRAMEEDLGEGHGTPMYYPWPYEHRTLSYLLVNDGGITVDGVLEESTEPDFSVFWQPYSPHPDGYTYGWIHCDNEFLYAAVEVTADNTPDADDWGALYIIVDGKQKEFRVSEGQTWGVRGFQYTSSVHYEHRIYEFKIPLSAINAAVGSEIHYIFGAYGTVASAPLTFDTVPANTGSIYFDGNSYSDGDSTPLPFVGTGPYEIEAVLAPGYVFVEWQVEGSISVDNPYSYVANLSVIGTSPSTLRMVQTLVLTAPRVSPSLLSPPHLPPADVHLNGVTVSSSETQPGQPVTVLASLVNNGASSGSYNVALRINGKVEQQRTVEVSPGTAYPVKFTVTKTQPGTYDVAIEGQKASFTVVGSTSGAPTSSGLIILIVMAVLILATAVVLMISFRRPA
ncbi:hypothetical protein ACFLTN_00400 [Chloroflexota bacterium]